RCVMGDVIQIGAAKQPKPETPSEHDYVWTCVHCDCQCFHLLESGVTVCVRCGYRSCDNCHDGQTNWRSHLADLPLNLAEIPPLSPVTSTIDQKPTPMIMQSFSKAVLSDDPVTLLMIRRD